MDALSSTYFLTSIPCKPHLVSPRNKGRFVQDPEGGSYTRNDGFILQAIADMGFGFLGFHFFSFGFVHFIGSKWSNTFLACSLVISLMVSSSSGVIMSLI